MIDVNQKRETADSLISYGVGGGGVSISMLSQYEPQISFTILVISLIVVLVRLVHDGLKFLDYLKDRKK